MTPPDPRPRAPPRIAFDVVTNGVQRAARLPDRVDGLGTVALNRAPRIARTATTQPVDTAVPPGIAPAPTLASDWDGQLSHCP